MSAGFQECLEGTIRYLEQRRDQGVRYVAVAPETLAALRAPAPRPDPGPTPRAAKSTRVKPTAQKSPVTPGPADLPSTIMSPAAPSPDASLSGPALTPEAKEQAMAALRQRVLACQICPHLAASRTQVVFGVGDIHSPLMFVGEAPGADEDRQGEPFVGRAGQLLTKIIEAMDLDRGRVFIGNVLKCRPDTPGQRSGNRKPTSAEMNTCLPHLLEQIRIIQPQVLVALGVTAVEGLFGKVMPITRLRGQWQDFHGIPVMPTYHPAYLLRNQSITEKRKVWEDMLQVMERLSMQITAKQRNYFLSPTS